MLLFRNRQGIDPGEQQTCEHQVDGTDGEKKDPEQEPVEAILQIKLKKDKKDQVLKLVFGENDIEILNK